MSLYNIDYVIPNKFSRPRIPLVGVRGIVIHYTANNGASDTGHQEFFDGDDGGASRYASAHMFVDSDSAVLIVPVYEVAYHANEKACRVPKLKATVPAYKNGDANLTTLGLEMCVEKDGTIHPNTIARSVQIVAEWIKTFNLTVNDVYRHFDITGKNCPAPFVANPALFTKFKADVDAILNGGGELDMSKDEVDFILEVLGDYYGRMAGNKDAQDYTHYVANALREATGREKQ